MASLARVLIVVLKALSDFYWPQKTTLSADGERTELLFGEVINNRFFEEDLVVLASLLRAKRKSVYDLDSVLTPATPLEEKSYVFITMYQMHASVVVIERELFKNTLLFEPIWGQMIDGPNITVGKDKKGMAAFSVPHQQYHVKLDQDNNYFLGYNMYHLDWFLKSRSFFVGESSLSYLYLQLLALNVAPKRYRLVASDCLEFAKNFAREIAVRENGVGKEDVKELLNTLLVAESEHFVAAFLEQFRVNPIQAFMLALVYFLSFVRQRFFIAVAVIAVLIYVVMDLWRRLLMIKEALYNWDLSLLRN